MTDQPDAPRGRGTPANPPNRFDRLAYEHAPGEGDDPPPAPATQFFRDDSRTLLTANDSPDVGFTASINPYRGCEHGCAYCYARPTHEYLGLSAGLDFESKILVKEDAPELLRRELAAPGWEPRVVGVSGVTDPYQPVERALRLTRRCLEVFAEFRNPVAVITKNRLVARDADVLADLARHRAAAVFVSVTTLDPELRAKLEPRTSTADGRLAAVAALARAGVPTGVMVAPVIPGLTDHEIPAIVEAAARAGAAFACYTVLRLPLAVAGLFDGWLARHYPNHREKVLARVEALHGGRRNSAEFGRRMTGEGVLAQMIRQLYEAACRKHGLDTRPPQLSAAAFRSRRGEYIQPSLFD